MVFKESAQLSKIKKSKDVLLRKIIPSRVVIDRGRGKIPPLCPTNILPSSLPQPNKEFLSFALDVGK